MGVMLLQRDPQLGLQRVSLLVEQLEHLLQAFANHSSNYSLLL